MKTAVRIRRPVPQRRVRVLLSFALLIPTAGFFQVSGVNPVSAGAGMILVACSLLLIYDAYRWVLIITRHGIGIAGSPGARTVWLSWQELTSVESRSGVLSVTARHGSVYQVEVGSRAAGVVSRLMQRNLVGS